MRSGREFRSDIGGLRAGAVIAVLLYHFHIRGFSGGFTGVDVFYVISGFLMTQIVVGQMPGSGASLRSFYMARTRRIVPALAVLCAAVLVYGAIFVDPMQYERMAKDGLSALLFVSNFWFAKQQGYFAPAADTNWFLHSWSLSVEWQFYLAYPLLLMALARSPLRNRVGMVLGLAALASIGLTEFIALSRPDLLQWSFFLLPTRAWEMLAGGLVAVWGEKIAWSPATRRIAAWGGLAAIAVSAVLLDNFYIWPSHWTLLPVVGAVLVIAANQPRPFWASLPGVQAIGRWSYSIYLWHWPLVCALAYFGLQTSKGAVIVALLASVALGALSYGLIEVRFRDWLFKTDARSVRRRVSATLVSILALACAGAFLKGLEPIRTIGLSAERKAILADYRAARADWRYNENVCLAGVAGKLGDLDTCQFGNTSHRHTLLIGDSHAQMLAPRYAGLDPAGPYGVTAIARGGCAPLPLVGRTIHELQCEPFNRAVFAEAASGKYQRVIFVGAWSNFLDVRADGRVYDKVCFHQDGACVIPRTKAQLQAAARRALDDFGAQLDRLRAAGVQPVVMLGLPFNRTNDPGQLYRDVFHGVTPPRTFSEAAFKRQAAFSRAELTRVANAHGALVIDPVEQLCHNGECPAYDEGSFLFTNGSHYRARATAGPLFRFLDPYFLGPAR